MIKIGYKIYRKKCKNTSGMLNFGCMKSGATP